MRYFNPRSPRGERLSDVYGTGTRVFISIHAPRGGSDRKVVRMIMAAFKFQSTLPAGGATAADTPQAASKRHFNPRSPRGGATKPGGQRVAAVWIFQSTLPAGGATLFLRVF